MHSTLPKRCCALVLCWLVTALAIPVASAEPFRRLMVDGLQVRWIAKDPQNLVLWYVILKSETQIPGARNCSGIAAPDGLIKSSNLSQDGFRDAVAQAFALWQTRINVAFVEADNAESADIVIGQQTTPTGFAFADVSINKTLQQSDVAQITKAAICLNPEKKWKIGFDGNLAVYDLVHTITHEIGHAIGLDHPSRNGHLMSFRYGELSRGLSDGDVQGAVELYGRRPADERAVATATAHYAAGLK